MYRFHAKYAALTVLPALFLSACVSQSRYDALQAQNQQLQEQVNRLQNAIRYTVNGDLLFESGSWQLSSNGSTMMARLASQLAPFQTRHIIINGYTDDAPISPALRNQGVSSNEELSQRRAQSVMQFLGAHGVNQQFMSAKGWGAASPIAPNSTTQGRAVNRRVEITFGA